MGEGAATGTPWTGGATGATGVSLPGRQLEVGDRWRVVDRWWTDSPINRYYMVVGSPTGEKAAVCWDSQTGEWSLQEGD